MLTLLATTAAQKRHLQEYGLIICMVGALAVLLSGAFGLRSLSRAVERSTMIVAGVLLGVGFALQLLAIHSGGK
jgi:hypothetical protein